MSLMQDISLNGGKVRVGDERYSTRSQSLRRTSYECYDDCDCYDGDCSDCICTDCQHCGD